MESWADSQVGVGSGGLPESATRRLAELRGGGLMSSFYGPAALAVGSAEGIEPVGQVLGASACQLALGPVRQIRGPISRFPVGAARWHENEGPVRSWSAARRAALARLLAQASILEAGLVLGVQARINVRHIVPPVVEFVLTGTAVRWVGRADRPARAPIAAMTSPQEFCLLRRAGIDVVGIVGACSSVEVSASSDTITATSRRRRRSANVELEDLTAAVYEARRLAVGRARSEAKVLRAAGVIGIDISDFLADHKLSATETMISVQMLGTAVTRRPRSALAARPVFGMEG